MKSITLLAALTTALAVPGVGHAEDPAPSSSSPHTLTGNVGLFSSYRFRGIDQSFGKPALQGGFDYAHSSGWYVGNWNSSVNSGAGFPDGHLEMDFYGGYKAAFGDFALDAGAIYYYYPGSQARGLGPGASSGAVSNQELYLGGSWKFLSLKYFYAIDDYFSLRALGRAGALDRSTRGTQYLDLSANFDLGDGWGLNAHVGRLDLANVRGGDYTDWKIGVSKDFNGWVVAASYIDTNASGSCRKGEFYCFTNSLSDHGGVLSGGSHSKDAGRGIVVVSLTRNF
ncbi:MAG: TorF family putative porin [Candidatus Accumulibacter sp.]|uniref:TorF family putative porin n=1 Tax=Accumulibacter sp. TaxID=2053492 RepID=UPI00287899E1|nr:TorF family putative porin [Accumulibacter sp.]MDS4014811.1 TorF family putative porin [Accumulibacter sp.]